MDPRIERIRRCADFLVEPHGGDREARCLLEAVRAALEVCADILAAHADHARGYRDAVDRMAACGAIDADLADRFGHLCDVVERLPGAWSTVTHAEFEWARTAASQTLLDFVEAVGDRLPSPSP